MTSSWLNDFGTLRRCTERCRTCVDAYLALAATIVTLRALRRAACLVRRLWGTECAECQLQTLELTASALRRPAQTPPIGGGS